MKGAVLALLLAWCSCATAASPLTAEQVATGIQARGAKAEIADLAAKDQWDTVADQISQGGSEWVALAPLLAPGSDAGSAEDLGIALAFALPKNAPAVLKAIDLHQTGDKVIAPFRVCGFPFIEDSGGAPTVYKRKALKALKAVKTAALQPAKTACLIEIEKIKQMTIRLK